jgi:tetratricopeptide (TPR) repeat protein
MRQILVLSILLASLLVAGACGSRSAASRDEHLTKGDQYLAAAKVNEAIVEYRLAVQADERHGPSRQKLGEALLRANDPIRAFRELVFAADLMPEDVSAQLRAGDVLLVVGQFEDARGRADKVLARDPRNVDAMILRGSALAGLKDLKGALAALQDAVRTDPARSEGYSHLGTLQFAQGDLQQAEAAFKRAVATDPKSVSARLALANLYWSTSRRREAEDAIKEASKLDPTNVAESSSGDALSQFWPHVRGRSALKVVAERSQGFAGKIMLADYYANVQRLPDAKAIYEQVVAAGGEGVPTAKLRLASLGLMGGDRAGGYRLIGEILAQNPKHVEALLARAQLLPADGQDRRGPGERPQRRGLMQAPWPSMFLTDSESSAPDGGRRGGFRKALRASPGSRRPMSELARISLQSGRYADAVWYAQAAVDKVPGFVEANLLPHAPKSPTVIPLAPTDRSKPWHPISRTHRRSRPNLAGCFWPSPTRPVRTRPSRARSPRTRSRSARSKVWLSWTFSRSACPPPESGSTPPSPQPRRTLTCN